MPDEPPSPSINPPVVTPEPPDLPRQVPVGTWPTQSASPPVSGSKDGGGPNPPSGSVPPEPPESLPVGLTPVNPPTIISEPKPEKPPEPVNVTIEPVAEPSSLTGLAAAVKTSTDQQPLVNKEPSLPPQMEKAGQNEPYDDEQEKKGRSRGSKIALGVILLLLISLPLLAYVVARPEILVDIRSWASQRVQEGLKNQEQK